MQCGVEVCEGMEAWKVSDITYQISGLRSQVSGLRSQVSGLSMEGNHSGVEVVKFIHMSVYLVHISLH